ncbi:protein-L-isoaspartate(D-aspartate) O-methyltransferase [bacterium]|nr:protein-L-isoaspartate(D-aspartate) O-methyltransferase [bacterium]
MVVRILSFIFLAAVPALPLLVCAGKNEEYAVERERMVNNQIKARGIRDSRVLKAMMKVPRHLFVPPSCRSQSYNDCPLPIGEGQTISQPYIVAFMTEVLELRKSDRVLEIGTGSGYQAAILGEIVDEVYTIELIPELGERARTLLEELGYTDITVKIGDGFKGWPEKAPFDAIIVTCAPEDIPPALVEQLKEGGRMIIPVGSAGGVQNLIKGVKKSGRLTTIDVLPVRFVPMIKGKN